MTTGTRTPPRPIHGTPGSRIRVLLGETGNDYLFVVNPDDGTREWQVTDWHRGHNMDVITRQITNCENKERYVTELDFHATTGAWYVAGVKRDGTGGHCWWGSNETRHNAVRSTSNVKVSFGSRKNCDGELEEMSVVINGRNNCRFVNIPSALENRICRIKNRDGTIHFIRLFDRGGFFISDSEGEEWGGLNPGVVQELRKPGPVQDVAVAKNGSWIVIRNNHFKSSPGVAVALDQKLELFYARQKSRFEARQREIQEYHEAEQRERDRLLNEAKELERLEYETRDAVRILKSSCREIQELRSEVDKRQKAVQAHLESLSTRHRAFVEARIGWESMSSPKAVCVVCQDKTAEHALVPCGHHCLCDDCSVQVMRASGTCPLCRKQALSTVKIYRQD